MSAQVLGLVLATSPGFAQGAPPTQEELYSSIPDPVSPLDLDEAPPEPTPPLFEAWAGGSRPEVGGGLRFGLAGLARQSSFAAGLALDAGGVAIATDAHVGALAGLSGEIASWLHVDLMVELGGHLVDVDESRIVDGTRAPSGVAYWYAGLRAGIGLRFEPVVVGIAWLWQGDMTDDDTSIQYWPSSWFSDDSEPSTANLASQAHTVALQVGFEID